MAANTTPVMILVIIEWTEEDSSLFIFQPSVSPVPLLVLS
jgi:hypothetical protein